MESKAGFFSWLTLVNLIKSFLNGVMGHGHHQWMLNFLEGWMAIAHIRVPMWKFRFVAPECCQNFLFSQADFFCFCGSALVILLMGNFLI